MTDKTFEKLMKLQILLWKNDIFVWNLTHTIIPIPVI